MTKDEIIRLAVQCQLSNGSNSEGIYFQALQSFAKLVAEKAIKEALAQPTPAEYAMGYAEGFNDACKPNYTAPPQRTWIGLTDEEIQSCWDGNLSPYQMKCIREIEAKLKQKNGFAKEKNT
jgi:hypothetical protein